MLGFITLTLNCVSYKPPLAVIAKSTLINKFCARLNAEDMAFGTDVPSGDEKFWKQSVHYFDPTASELPPRQNVREIPLFLLEGAFFPQGNTFLHIFEMKYRTMMFDVKIRMFDPNIRISDLKIKIVDFKSNDLRS